MNDSTNNIREIFQGNYRGDDQSLQEALLAIKEKGYSQMQTLKLLVEEFDISLQEADEIILHSAAWQGVKKDNLEARDSFADNLDKDD